MKKFNGAFGPVTESLKIQNHHNTNFALFFENKIRGETERGGCIECRARGQASTNLQQGSSDLNKIWLTVKEAASYLGISRGTLRNLHSNGKIRASKPFGKLLYFRRAELDRLIESSEFGGVNGDI